MESNGWTNIPRTPGTQFSSLTSVPFCMRTPEEPLKSSPTNTFQFMKHMVCADGSQPRNDFNTWLGGPGSLAVPLQWFTARADCLSTNSIQSPTAETFQRNSLLDPLGAQKISVGSCAPSQRRQTHSFHLVGPYLLQTKHVMVWAHCDRGLSSQVKTDTDHLRTNSSCLLLFSFIQFWGSIFLAWTGPWIHECHRRTVPGEGSGWGWFGLHLLVVCKMGNYVLFVTGFMLLILLIPIER